MSYNNDVMMCLVNAIRSLEPLEVNLETLNENISVFERIAEALEEQNELKKIELGIESKTNIQRRRQLFIFFLLLYAYLIYVKI